MLTKDNIMGNLNLSDCINISLKNLELRIYRAKLKSVSDKFHHSILDNHYDSCSDDISTSEFQDFLNRWNNSKLENIQTSEIDIECDIESEYHDYCHSSYWDSNYNYSYSYCTIVNEITDDMILNESLIVARNFKCVDIADLIQYMIIIKKQKKHSDFINGILEIQNKNKGQYYEQKHRRIKKEA